MNRGYNQGGGTPLYRRYNNQNSFQGQGNRSTSYNRNQNGNTYPNRNNYPRNNYNNNQNWCRNNGNTNNYSDNRQNNNASMNNTINVIRTEESKEEHAKKTMNEICNFLRNTRPHEPPQKGAKINGVNGIKISEDFTLEAYILGTPLRVLIDTGAVISIIKKEALQKIQKEVKILKPKYDKIVSVNLSESQIEGMIKETLTMGDFAVETELHILPGASFDVLLGRNFINKHIKRIEPGNKLIEFVDNNGQVFKAEIQALNVEKGNKTKKAGARIARRTTIPPKTEKYVEIFPTNNIIATKLKFEQNQWSRLAGLHIRNQEVEGYTDTMKILVRNVTDVEDIALQ